METLQGLSAAELSTAAGRRWRTAYSDPDNSRKEGLDSTIWPKAFERMEQFIRDTGLSRADLDMNYDDVAELYKNGKLAMYFGKMCIRDRDHAEAAGLLHLCVSSGYGGLP